MEPHLFLVVVPQELDQVGRPWGKIGSHFVLSGGWGGPGGGRGLGWGGGERDGGGCQL